MASHIKSFRWFLLMMIVGCGSSEADRPQPTASTTGGELHQEGASAEITSSSQENVLIDPRVDSIKRALDDLSAKQKQKLAQRGKKRFSRACGTCHPGGEEDIGPSLRGIEWSIANMYRQIRKGSGKMRPITEKRLPEDDMTAVMHYLQTLGAVSNTATP